MLRAGTAGTTDSDWEITTEKDHTQGGTRRKDDVMQLKSDQERPALLYIPIGFQHSEAKCAKQKKKCTRVSEYSYK